MTYLYIERAMLAFTTPSFSVDVDVQTFEEEEDEVSEGYELREFC